MKPLLGVRICSIPSATFLPTHLNDCAKGCCENRALLRLRSRGRSGDGGIDGHGIIRLAGLISFPVLFQCKRYSGSVSPSVVRDFRGAMMGRAEKGVILTTGGFTKEAQREATRDGVPLIDLIDGELLIDKIKELELGVSVRKKMVEVVEVDRDWFASI